MELSPFDLLEAARRWSAEVDALRQASAAVRDLPESAFGAGVRESAAASAAAWSAAISGIVDDVGRCAEGLRDTAQLGLAVDADVAASLDRLAEKHSR